MSSVERLHDRLPVLLQRRIEELILSGVLQNHPADESVRERFQDGFVVGTVLQRSGELSIGDRQQLPLRVALLDDVDEQRIRRRSEAENRWGIQRSMARSPFMHGASSEDSDGPVLCLLIVVLLRSQLSLGIHQPGRVGCAHPLYAGAPRSEIAANQCEPFSFVHAGYEDHRVSVDMPDHHGADDEIQDTIVVPRNDAWERLDLVLRDVVDPQHVRLCREAVQLRGLGRHGSGDQHVVVVSPIHAAQLFFADAHIANHLAVGDGGHEDEPLVALGAHIRDARAIGRQRNVLDAGQPAIDGYWDRPTGLSRKRAACGQQ